MNNNVNTNNDANIMLFQNENFGAIRVIKQDGEPWFVAKDIASLLEIRDAFAAVRGLDDDEKGTHFTCTPGGTQEIIIISESGLYSLLVRSNKEIAKPFRRWVTHEVLPQIRKTGGYIPVKKDDTDLEVMCRAFEIQRKTIEALEVEQTLNAPKVATYDAFLSEADDEIPMGTLANRLCQEGLPFGLQRLYAYLRQQGVLCEKGSRRNLPTQRYVAKGWFKVIAPPPYAGENWKPTLRVTPKGVTEITSRIHELMDVGESIGA